MQNQLLFDTQMKTALIVFFAHYKSTWKTSNFMYIFFLVSVILLKLWREILNILHQS